MSTEPDYANTVCERVWSGPHFAEVMFDGSVRVSTHMLCSRHVGRRLKKRAARKFDRMMDDLVEQAKKNVAERNSYWDAALSRSLR